MSTNYTAERDRWQHVVVTPSRTEASIFTTRVAAESAAQSLNSGADPEWWVWHPYDKVEWVDPDAEIIAELDAEYGVAPD